MRDWCDTHTHKRTHTRTFIKCTKCRASSLSRERGDANDTDVVVLLLLLLVYCRRCCPPNMRGGRSAMRNSNTHTHTHAHVSSRLPAVHLQICTQWQWFRSHRQHVYVARARHAFRNMRHAYLRGCTRVCVGKRRDIATACLVKTFPGCQSTHTHTHIHRYARSTTVIATAIAIISHIWALCGNVRVLAARLTGVRISFANIYSSLANGKKPNARPHSRIHEINRVRCGT